MRIQRLNAARRVAAHLFAAEKAIDLAVTRIAELNAALPTARMEANLAAAVGQNAFESSAEAMVSAARVRQLLVTTHKRLSDAGVGIGLREVSWGDELKIPSAEIHQLPAKPEAA